MLAAVYRARRGPRRRRKKQDTPSAQGAEEQGEKRSLASALPSAARDVVHLKKRKTRETARQGAAAETQATTEKELTDPERKAKAIEKTCQSLRPTATKKQTQKQVLAPPMPCEGILSKKSQTSGSARRRAAAEARAKQGKQLWNSASNVDNLQKSDQRSVAKLESASLLVSERTSVQGPYPELPPITRSELQDVHVSGRGAESPALKPWLSFEEVRKGGPNGKLPPAVVAYMGKFKGFKDPTPIQAHCWPAACAGRDVVGISKTGSGKTLAYLCPGLSRILSFRRAVVPTFGPYVVVLAPTRELTIQIAREAKGLCLALNIQLACLYGGASKAEQIKGLDKGVDLIVAAPGRLDDFVSKPDKFTGRTLISLSMVCYLVLDEADCMLDLGFEPQVRRLRKQAADDCQLLCFSATWPRKVETLVREFSQDALHIRIGSSTHASVAGNHNVEQQVVVISPGHMGDAHRQAKKRELWKILLEHHGERSLVFCARKKTAAVLAHQLKEDGFCAGGLHGDMLQQDRESATRAFKTGGVHILVATDVAARGLDVNGIALVVSYDAPTQLEQHVHRIGRTARGKDVHGKAYTLLSSEDVRSAELVAESIRVAGQTVPSALAELPLQRVESSKS